MILRLRLGVGDAGQAREEALLGVDRDERHVEVVAEGGDDLLALVAAHQAVVDEHAGELVAHRTVDEQRGHRRVDPAGEPADHVAVAHLLADAGDLLVDHRGGGPGHVAAADVLEEAAQHLVAVGRVDDLRVELDAVEAARDVLEGRDRRLVRRRERQGARRRLEDRVAVAHPAALLGRQPGQQAARARGRGGRSGRTRRPTRPPRGRPARAPSPACRNRCRAPGCRARAAQAAARGAPSL